MQLNPQHMKIASLLDGRLFRIPEYQRAYSWRSKQRSDLFHDIEEANRSDREHFMATLVALAIDTRKIDADEFRTVELVDGQQRITTLIILLKSIEKELDASKTKENRLKREIEELLIKGDEHSLILLQTNHDTSNVFANYIRQGRIEESALTAADQNLINAFNECESFVSNWSNDERNLVQLVATIKNKLSIIYHELADEATVYRVFEVLNSRGLDVKWIDKLKSQLMALIFEYVEEGTRTEAVREMQSIWQRIYRALGNDTKIGDEALRFSGTWTAESIPNRIASEESATLLLGRAAGPKLKNISAVGHQLAAVVDADLKLIQDPRLKAVTRIAHARFVATAIIMRKMSKKDETELLGKWERVTFRIFELGGADTRYKVGEYVRLGYEIYKSKLDKAEILSRLDQLSLNYSIGEVLANFDASDCYSNWTEQLRYILYRYDEHLSAAAGQRINTSQWNKIWADDPSRSIEHVQPQSKGQKYTHELGNLTMLPPGVNSSLGDNPPVTKADAYKTSGLIGSMHVGNSIEEHQKWNAQLVGRRTKEILKFIRSEWAD